MSVFRNSSTYPQFEVMVQYMEKYGDLNKTFQGDPYYRIEKLKRWIELVGLLNDHPDGVKKSADKWRKTWSDFKNNTKRKIQKIRLLNGKGPPLTDLEIRVLKLLGDSGCRTSNADFVYDDEEAEGDGDGDANDNNNDDEDGNDSNDDDNSNDVTPKEELIDIDFATSRKSLSPQPSPNFCAVNGKRTRPSPRVRAASTSSRESTPAKKSKSDHDTSDCVKNLTEKFIELEKDKEKMMHEREMAKMKQTDHLLAVFSRFTNVLESLAPSIKRYLDRET